MRRPGWGTHRYFTMSLDIGNMPCNPQHRRGGKGNTLVREVDALGGLMGLAADATYRSRMLNKGQKPGGARFAGADRPQPLYHAYMKQALELTPALPSIRPKWVELVIRQGRVEGVRTQLHAEYGANVRCAGHRHQPGGAGSL